MKNIILSIFGTVIVLLFLLCCSTKKRFVEDLTSPVTYFILDSLVCKNLSEDAKGFGSKDDEILALVYLVDQKGGIVQRWHSEYIPITKWFGTSSVDLIYPSLR